MNVNQKYLKDEDGIIISPVTGVESVMMNEDGDSAFKALNYTNGTLKTGKIWLNEQPVYRFSYYGTLSGLSTQFSSLGACYPIQVWGMAYSIYRNWWPIPNYMTGYSNYSIRFILTTDGYIPNIVYGSYYDDDNECYFTMEFVYIVSTNDTN